MRVATRYTTKPFSTLSRGLIQDSPKRIATQNAPSFQVEVGRESYVNTNSCFKALVGSCAGAPYSELPDPVQTATEDLIKTQYQWMNLIRQASNGVARLLVEDTKGHSSRLNLDIVSDFSGFDNTCDLLHEVKRPIILNIPFLKISDNKYYPHTVLITGFHRSEKGSYLTGIDAHGKDRSSLYYRWGNVNQEVLKEFQDNKYTSSVLYNKFPENTVSKAAASINSLFDGIDEAYKYPAGFIVK
jgi:hypothetical protein